LEEDDEDSLVDLGALQQHHLMSRPSPTVSG